MEPYGQEWAKLDGLERISLWIEANEERLGGQPISCQLFLENFLLSCPKLKPGDYINFQLDLDLYEFYRPDLLSLAFFAMYNIPENVFILKQGNLPNNSIEKIGTAYGFFKYADRTKNILKLLPDIWEYVETPSELTLELIKGVDNLNTENNSDLVEIVQVAKQASINYALKATLPNTNNENTASLLGDIMSGIAVLAGFPEKPFYSDIFYEVDGKYIRKDE